LEGSAVAELGKTVSEMVAEKRYKFAVFYHPYIGEFIEQLNKYGIEGLFNPDSQGKSSLSRQMITSEFFIDYDPNSIIVHYAYPRDDVDFTAEGAYSLYNWELFFHAPLLIATRLTKNQRFEEAQKWFHYIFDPMATDSPNNSGPERFWKVNRFTSSP